MATTLLTLKNVHKYYGSLHALKGISFDLLQQEIVSLLGVNGAGKTTLSSIIATLHPASEGDILYEGSSIYKDIPRYRKHIGYCPQQANLNPLLSIKDNLIFAGKYFGMNKTEIHTRLEELDHRIGLSKYLHLYSPQLSGGWKQRYMIARTLMHSPKIVILDEPTVALDPDVRHQLWVYIKHIRDEGACVLLTTHYIDEAEYLSDRVCVLDNGQVAHIDSPKNLMNSFAKGRLEDVFLQLTKELAE